MEVLTIHIQHTVHQEKDNEKSNANFLYKKCSHLRHLQLLNREQKFCYSTILAKFKKGSEFKSVHLLA